VSRGAALKAGLRSRGKDGLGLARQRKAVQGKAVEVRYVSSRLGGLVSICHGSPGVARSGKARPGKGGLSPQSR
jgi:hypothetical protein